MSQALLVLSTVQERDLILQEPSGVQTFPCEVIWAFSQHLAVETAQVVPVTPPESSACGFLAMAPSPRDGRGQAPYCKDTLRCNLESPMKALGSSSHQPASSRQ
ncbi:hypothetical protein H920_20196 [Fukomys damarensis]|uniref:Uncharacterized protein n=1 Tax=Fukomys damarensis TaxID=885580 RepID=A0A091CM00_FUKDA|nr:hypothetical protein H920_20196 [Fukomys damarensis]